METDAQSRVPGGTNTWSLQVLFSLGPPLEPTLQPRRCSAMHCLAKCHLQKDGLESTQLKADSVVKAPVTACTSKRMGLHGSQATSILPDLTLNPREMVISGLLSFGPAALSLQSHFLVAQVVQSEEMNVFWTSLYSHALACYKASHATKHSNRF